MKKLRICYDAPDYGVDLAALEEALMQTLYEHGYEFVSSGYDLSTGQRKLAFEEVLPCE